MSAWTCLVLLVAAFLMPGAVSGLFNLTILHTNDFHARYDQNNKYSSPCSDGDAAANKCFGGTARLVTMVRQQRAMYPNSLLLDAGDQFQGTIWFTQFRSNLTAAHMGWLGYDAMALGNHEFDLGIPEVVNFLQKLDFPVLSANIDTSLEPSIAGLFNKSTVLTVDGEQIGVIGYTTTETKDISKPGRLEFLDELTQIRAEVGKLEAMGVNKIIALGHAGFNVDLMIAERVSGIDVVVGGHTNTFLYTGTAPSNEDPVGEYPRVVVQQDGARVLCVQDYAYGKYLGVLHVSFNASGHLVSWGGNPVLLNASVAQNQTIVGLLEPYSRELDAVRNTTVGRSHVMLIGGLPCRVEECNFGNVIADGMVKQNIKHSDTLKWNHVAMAIINAGGIRAPVDRGDVTIEDVLTVLPFQNTVDIVNVTGSTLLAVFEHSASKWTRGDGKFGGFLQVSGLRVTYDMSQPIGQRVRQLLVTCIECPFPRLELVQHNATYNVIVPNFIVTGGDGYRVLRDNLLEHHIIGDLDSAILMEYLKAESPLVTGLEGRIVLAEPPEPEITCDCVNAAFDWRPRSSFTPVSLIVTLVSLVTLILD